LKHLFDNGRPGVALELDRKRWEIARAIWTLTELLPATRPDYESEVEVATMEKWRDVADPDYADWARANLAAFDELVRAAGAAWQLGLPIVGIDRLAPDVTRPTDLIKQLDLSLSTSQLHLSAAERHRLVAEVARLIVGDGLKGLDQARVRDRIRKSGEGRDRIRK
jgi:hypothetical protein